jgi:hypothetical protein
MVGRVSGIGRGLRGDGRGGRDGRAPVAAGAGPILDHVALPDVGLDVGE